MTVSSENPFPKVEVVPSGRSSSSDAGLKELFTRGDLWIGTGGAFTVAFAVEAVQSFVTGDPLWGWWSLALLAAGIGVGLWGWWLRGRFRSSQPVGVVMQVANPWRDSGEGDQRESNAREFGRKKCVLVAVTKIVFPEDRRTALLLVDQLVSHTRALKQVMENLSPGASRVELMPIMPLHAGFRAGARLGYTHSREVMVHSVKASDHQNPVFPAVPLRVPQHGAAAPSDLPLEADKQPRTIDGADPRRVALALDLQNRGEEFVEPVMEACRQYDFGSLVLVRTTTGWLPENQETFSGIVDTICDAWRQASLPEGAHTEQRAIFLSGPVAIAVALGARLATANHNSWTAFTFDSDNGSYEPFPSTPRVRK
ncbi:SAVED domain-containing protein [Lipingzhangella sp. LS1_29]|uniref:SAVED domain-containing protein n=1 Tax=Lipingzhangella rawalii TaxID=2055835 RepID=A0ABU2H5X4_9ACTN|nr:SAVED domain-containing protein [Lipingzhangella rawalii]MDS1270704.1 SAVED domain-containing protein [Lipingzhangella rawalii]